MIVQITHTDLDGIGCEVIGKQHYGKELRVKKVNYDRIDQVVRNTLRDLTRSDTLIISDIFVENDEMVEELRTFPGILLVFDHHKTAIPRIKKLMNERGDAMVYTNTVKKHELYYQAGHRSVAVVREGVSATRLMAWYFRQDLPSVKLVDEYDTTGTVEGDAGKLNYLHYSIEPRKMKAILLRDPFYFNSEENEIVWDIIAESEKYLKRQIKTLKSKVVRGHKVAVLEAVDRKAFIYSKLLKEHDYATIIDRERDLIGFRGKLPGCELIAQKFGGGGHPTAAGANGKVTVDEIFKAWEEVLSA